MKREQNITEGVIWKQILIFFFPILMGTFFQQMYNTVDAIIVGRYVGTLALAAVGSTGYLINLVCGFFIGVSSGATVVLSQFFGAEDRAGVSKAIHSGMVLAVVLGVLTTVFGVGGSPMVLRLIRTPESCLPDATVYTRIYFGGAIVSMVYNMGAGILRAMGDSRRPLIFLIVTCFTNIALDILFVVVFNWGVAGAAAATVTAQAISAVLVIRTLRNLSEDIRLSTKKLRLDPELLRRILAVGVPAGLQFITFDLANLLVQSSINSFGAVTMAAWTAFGKTDSLTWMISGAFGVAVTTFVGQNYGARKYDRIRKGVWVCMGMSVAMIGGFSVFQLCFRKLLLGFFTVDAEVIQVGAYAMLWIVPFSVVFMPMEILAGTLRGIGNSVTPTAITSICICGFRVLWVTTVVQIWHTIEVLCLTYPLSWLLASTVFFIVYLRGRWLDESPKIQ